MGRLRLLDMEGVSAVRAAAPAWDDLWRRSEVTLPTARAELVAQWAEKFAPGTTLRTLVVADGPQWVAALPLVEVKLGHVLRAGGLPQNDWSPGGDLLLDPGAGAVAALDVLVAAFGQLPWPLLWLGSVASGAPRWKAFVEAGDRAGLGADCHDRFEVGMIDTAGDWQAYRKTWSKNHRRNIGKSARRLGRDGGVEFRLHSQLPPNRIEPFLLRGFEVEDRSWKGAAGTSVLRTAGMLPFYVRQARQLAAWGQLELAFLQHADRPIAFEYALCAKGVYHSFKVGYDQHYAAAGPGQLLMHEILKRMHLENGRRAMDCMGPLSEAVARWRPRPYPIGRLVVAPRRVLGQALFHAYKHWWPHVRRLRSKEPAPT